MKTGLSKIIAVLGFILGTANFLWAHDPGLSSAEIRLGSKSIILTGLISAADVGAMDGETGRWTPSRLKEWAGTAFALETGGKVLSPRVVESRMTGETASVTLTFPRGGSEARIDYRFAGFDDLPRGHRQYVTVYSEDGMLQHEDVLSFSVTNTKFQAASSLKTPRPLARTHFFTLGIKHILLGFDHLVFLFALLAVTKGPRSAIGIITRFTVAHSISLILGVYKIIALPSSLVEPLIAASIIFVAIENLIFPEGKIRLRIALTFLFGLVHGLGFCGILEELGFGSGGKSVLWPLLLFNLGIEAGQIAIAVFVLPVMWHLKNLPAISKRWIPACSTAVLVAGVYWLIDRL